MHIPLSIAGFGSKPLPTANAAILTGLIGDGATTAAPDWFSIGDSAAPCNNPNLHLICIEP
jgi:hypothetical protein